jgi:hypothetical protein
MVKAVLKRNMQTSKILTRPISSVNYYLTSMIMVKEVLAAKS